MVIMHGGPFGNLSHGTNSLISTDLALRLVGEKGFVIIESGFGTELGAEKFIDIISRLGVEPCAAVIVVTVKALKFYGDNSLENGIKNNLEPHILNVIKLGMTPVIAINKFDSDDKHDIDCIHKYCRSEGVACSTVDIYNKGGNGAISLAHFLSVIKTSVAKPLYHLRSSLKSKIEAVASQMYNIKKVRYSKKATVQIRHADHLHLPICIVKSQYELTPKNFTVRNVEVMAGAGFIIVETDEAIRMPGLSEHPRAEKM